MSYGSALGQDRWIYEEVFPGRRDGFFVEAGALNGVDESNTIVLEKTLGWKGLCVEPASEYFRTLKKERKCAVENACLYDRETEVDFIEAGGHGGILAHFSADYRQKGKPTRKSAFPLEKLLTRNQAPPIIEYLSLDTEGTEYIILKDFPFDRFKFLAITVEHNHNIELRDQLRKLLLSKDYILCREVLVDDWWVHRSHYETIDPERRELWRLLNRFPPSEASIRAQETQLRFQELEQETKSILKTAKLFSKVVRKKLLGKTP